MTTAPTTIDHLRELGLEIAQQGAAHIDRASALLDTAHAAHKDGLPLAVVEERISASTDALVAALVCEQRSLAIAAAIQVLGTMH